MLILIVTHMRPWLLAVISLLGSRERECAPIWMWNISKDNFK